MIEISGLEVHFGHVHALRGVDLVLRPGEVAVLIGPNGAGKSTVVNAVAGLVRPSAGQIAVDGLPCAGKSPRQMIDVGVTLVPQGRRLFGSMSVLENIEMGAYTQRDRTAVRQRMEGWLGLFPEVASRTRARAASLSGGQQQLVAIMRGLMSKPHMLMMDEPSIGLAPAVVRRIGAEIRRLRTEAGLGIVLVEQNIPFALEVADRIAILASGRVVYDGDPAPLRDPDLLAAYFFGDPAGIDRSKVPGGLQSKKVEEDQ